MLLNYLKLALRSLKKNGLFSSIKLIGLTIGIVASLLIGLYVRHELSYDAFHDNAERIARVKMEYHFNGETVHVGVTGSKVAPAFQQDFPEVEKAVRVYSRSRVVKADGQPPREEEHFYFADSTFFEVFTFPLLAGDPSTALDEPDNLVITESTAGRYFGDANPIGQVLRVEDRTDYTITGVMADPPAASQMKPDFVAAFHSLPVASPERETWWSANWATFLLLEEPGDIADLDAKIPAYMHTKSEETGLTGDDYLSFNLEPIRDVHLRSDVEGNFEPSGDIRYVYILGIAGVLILVIAASIYVNLSIAVSTKRARQVGVQKVLGATPGRLFRQHLTEAILVCGAALGLSVPIAALLLPAFNQMLDVSLSAAVILDPRTLLLLVGFGTVVGLLAGAYPALVLSRLQPSRVLKGTFSLSPSGLWLRKSLVVVQFFISVGLIICTLVLQDQMSYIQHKNLGYDKDHVLVLRMDRQSAERLDVLRSEFLQNAQVKSVSVAYETPTYIQGGYSIALNASADRGSPVTALPADRHFLETFDIDVVAGRGFSESDVELARRIDQGRDSTSALPILINQSQVRSFGWTPEEAIGRRVHFQGESEIRGVVEDFHFASLHEPIGELVIFPTTSGNSLMVKVDGENLASTLAFLEDRWTSIVPHRPFTSHFLDEEFDQMYGTEIRMAQVGGAFSGVAILLACLGLFGLASFTIVQRTKEIGIRKVLGATIPNLVTVLSADFLKLVVIAFLAAVPVTYIAMQRWLEDFAYRTDLSLWIFLGAGAAAVLIALVTVSYQAIRSAVSNPVKSLRYE